MTPIHDNVMMGAVKGLSMKTKGKINYYPFTEVQSGPYEDPIKSHDGMDIDSRTAVVETTGYEFRLNVAEDVIEAFEQDLEDVRDMEEAHESLNDRLNNCPSISKEDQGEPSFEYVR